MRPKLTGVLETALYVDDVERARAFYERLFGFESLGGDDRLVALSVAGRQVLLVCKRGASLALGATAHDATGQQHLCLAVEAAELDRWEKWLAENKVEIIERRTWERGGAPPPFLDARQHLPRRA